MGSDEFGGFFAVWVWVFFPTLWLNPSLSFENDRNTVCGNFTFMYAFGYSGF